MIRAYCPILGRGCPQAWDCGRCRLLVYQLRALRIPNREVSWVCATCALGLCPKRDRQGRLHPDLARPGGFYTEGICPECGKFSAVMQLIITNSYWPRWKEILYATPEEQ